MSSRRTESVAGVGVNKDNNKRLETVAFVLV